MSEYYVELQDIVGTYYGITDWHDEPLYFEDIDDARMYARDQLDDRYIVARIIDSANQRVVDFFKK